MAEVRVPALACLGLEVTRTEETTTAIKQRTESFFNLFDGMAERILS